jgi:signal transduction histidine kinase
VIFVAALRRLGPRTGRPLVLLQHFRGNLENWDPELIDALSVSVTLVVRNTGRPISPDVVPLLAEPFYRGAGRTGRSSGSRGLGLAIAESIAAAHGTGLRLTANQSGDGGLTAGIDLPRP